MANDGSPPRVAGRSAWGRRRIGILGIVAIGTVLLLTIPGGLGVLRSPPPWSSSSVPKVPPAPTSPLPPTPNASTPFPTPIRHVFVVVLENAARSTVLQKGAFEATLASQYAQASAYYGICHPSAPNYLSMTGGSPRQCGSDNWNVYNATNLGDLAEAAGRTWKAYVESMPTPCDTSDAYPYAVKHNPFVFYSDIVTNATRCAEHDVNFTAFTSDVEAGTLPNLGFITPNLTDDGHDTSVATADAWLKGWLSPLMNDSFYNSSVFFVTYDESVNDNSGYNGTAGGKVFFAAVSPYARGGYDLATNASHFNLLSTVEWLLGLGSIAGNVSGDTFPALPQLFQFPVLWTLHGVVRSAATGAPISGAQVSVGGQPSEATDALGAYSFNLTNGSYLLTVSADGFVPTVAPTTIAGVPVELNISLVPVTPVVFPVSGEVSNASSGAPLAGATVLVNGTNASVTSVAGMYALALPNGTYRLEAEEPGFVTAATTVRVANGPVVANFSLNRSLPAYFSISGTVTAASSATPVAGALVTTDRGGSSTTDAAGRYVLDVENGTYLVTVNASGYSPQTTAVVVSGANRTADFELAATTNSSTPPGGRIRLTAVAAPDPVAAGSSVELTAIIDGGVPPYTASWEFGDNASATGLTVWHAFRVAGAYTVHLVVLDSANQTARNQTTVTVTVAPPAAPLPSGGGSSGAFPGAWSGTVGLAGVALGLGGAEIVMARWAVRLWRRTSSPSPSAPPS